MKYTLSTYRHTILPQVKMWCDSKGGSPIKHVSELALATSCPIVVISIFIKELYGDVEGLESLIGDLKAFYNAEVEE